MHVTAIYKSGHKEANVHDASRKIQYRRCALIYTWTPARVRLAARAAASPLRLSACIRVHTLG